MKLITARRPFSTCVLSLSVCNRDSLADSWRQGLTQDNQNQHSEHPYEPQYRPYHLHKRCLYYPRAVVCLHLKNFLIVSPCHCHCRRTTDIKQEYRVRFASPTSNHNAGQKNNSMIFTILTPQPLPSFALVLNGSKDLTFVAFIPCVERNCVGIR
jgi:hypothetical protein